MHCYIFFKLPPFQSIKFIESPINQSNESESQLSSDKRISVSIQTEAMNLLQIITQSSFSQKGEVSTQNSCEVKKYVFDEHEVKQ